MAKEIQLPYTSGLTLRAMIFRATDGKVWNTSGTPAFETYATANIANYAVTMTEQGTASQIYMGDFPSGITTPGLYYIVVRKRAGGSLAETDVVAGVGEILWDGSAVVDQSSLANLYTVDVGCSLHDNDGTPADRWTIVFIKNGVRITSGVTSPTMTVTKRSDGTALLSAVALTEIGTTEAWKYDATGASRIDPEDIQNCFAVVTATIDGASRTCYGGIIIRDQTAAGSP